MTTYKVLELFFGNGSFSRACLELGFEVIGVGIEPCPLNIIDEIEYHQIDILKFDYSKLPKINIIWSSPVCATYSMGGISHKHREKCIAITDLARLHDSYVLKVLEMIKALKPQFDIMENPIGCLRKQPFMKGIPNAEVTYCQYGDFRMKPTDLFGNLPKGFRPKRCKNGDPCHVASPRGSRTGTQGMPKHLKSRIPFALCYEIAARAKGEMNQ